MSMSGDTCSDFGAVSPAGSKTKVTRSPHGVLVTCSTRAGRSGDMHTTAKLNTVTLCHAAYLERFSLLKLLASAMQAESAPVLEWQ